MRSTPLGWILLAGLACGVARCSAPAPSPRVGVYAAELTACVETARSKEESRACREDVMRRYGRLDGGAP